MTILSEVFGVTSKQVKSYIPRENIDDLFKNAIATDNHVVVYGASKQGKTALVSRYLSYDDNIVVRLSPKQTVEDIYSSVLRQAGVTLEADTTTGTEKKAQLSAGAKFKAKIPLIGEAQISTNTATNNTKRFSTRFETIAFNIAVPQDISELLKKVGMDKKIILENFHYLDEGLQRQISYDLRLFQEMGILFVVLGVWRQKDKLRIFCPDLTDRLTDIPVEPWEETDFRKVAALGAMELNAEISTVLIETCIRNSFGSIGVFQELLKATCTSAGLTKRNLRKFTVNDEQYAQHAISEKSEQYGQTHRQALELISSGNITHSKDKALMPLHLPYYLVRAILEMGYEGFKNGADRAELTDEIKANHHRSDDVRPSDISNLLHNLSATQHKKGINPPLIDYDQSKRRLFAIDSTFFFFLKNCNLKEFLEELHSPIPLQPS